jgi:hypothetical protein
MLLVLPSMKGTMRFAKLDLSGINGINLNTISQGEETNFTIEVRLDGDNGTVIGNGVLASGINRNDSKAKISIQPVTDGKEHTISIVFRSSNAGGKKRPLVKSVDFLSI